MNKYTLAAVLLALLAAAAILTVIVTGNDDQTGIEIDEDDYISFSSEDYGRITVSSYDKKAELFLSKAITDDDRDGDGTSTIDSCLKYISNDAKDGNRLYEAILDFIHNEVGYVKDSVLYDSFDWAAYPVETLYHSAGDCEDLVILTVALLDRAGYECGIALFKDHAVAMVVLEDIIRTDDQSYIIIEEDGKTYWCLEMTQDCEIGRTLDKYDLEGVKAFKTIHNFKNQLRDLA
ncbi:MAG: hypothetical protein IKQ93_04810 [Candidatus Methanomethylophilaceae archaeon]|nr:hypothetical protein [Candidatus Methanomethylophilaceae archaeon]